jgi:hypothetical protein
MANSEYGQDRSVNGIDEAIIALYFVIAQMPDQDIHQKNRREQIRLSIRTRLKGPLLEVKFHKLLTEIRTEYEVAMGDKDTIDEHKSRYNPPHDEEGSEEVDKTKKRKSDREVMTDITDFQGERSSLPSIPPTSNNDQQRIHELELTVNRLKGKSRTLEDKVKTLEDQLRDNHHEWMGERADFLEALEIERIKLTTAIESLQRSHFQSEVVNFMPIKKSVPEFDELMNAEVQHRIRTDAFKAACDKYVEERGGDKGVSMQIKTINTILSQHKDIVTGILEERPEDRTFEAKIR